jgi:serine/threonine protein kinase
LSIQPGARIGPYEVSALLGVGGMGEVYRATDSNLKRAVALKVLPAAVSGDADRLARFQREAEVLAALNHPNIAAIYGLERAAGVTALVMELVDGPTLADLIEGTRLPIEQALPIAQQIADALAAAHDQGIVHRDLKPANVKVRPDGTVKVLDFGLAKATDDGRTGQAGQADLSHSPTITSPAMTAMGMILGTAAYMSPEQASGKAVDKRADIWAFGVVLWEMLAGRRLFEGETISHVLAAVLTKDPDLEAVPARVRLLLGRCLDKDPKKRLRDIGDAMSLVRTPDVTTVPGAPSRRWITIGGWAAAVVFAIVSTALLVRRPAPIAVADQPLIRFQIPRVSSDRDNLSVDPYNNLSRAFAVSPDGRYLAYYIFDGRLHLMVRTLATGEQREVLGSANVTAQGTPIWSADSQQLVYQLVGTAQVYDLTRGTSRSLCTCRFFSGTWNRDGVLLIGSTANAGSDSIRRLSLTDRAIQDVTTPDPAKRERDTLPMFLPDGRRFLFTRSTPDSAPATWLGTLDGQAPKKLTDGSRFLFATSLNGSGPLVLGIDEGGLVARAIDLETMTVASESLMVAPGAVAASISDNGILATSARGARPNLIPTWFDRAGTAMATIGAPRIVESLGLSPDASRIAEAVSRDGGPNDLWLRDVTSGASSRLTFDPANDADPVWSPDGKRLVFAAIREGIVNIVERAADGTGGETQLFSAVRNAYPNAWSTDGHWVIYTQIRTGDQADMDLWVVPISAGVERKPVPYLVTPGRKAQAAFSPDNRFVAYISDESGTVEVYVQPFPNATDGKWMISSGGGVEPRWSADGKELFYFSGQALMAAPISLEPTFSSRPPIRLFDAPIQAGYINDSDRWQVAPDGKRFLLLAPAGKNEAPPIDVVVNWPALLRK